MRVRDRVVVLVSDDGLGVRSPKLNPNPNPKPNPSPNPNPNLVSDDGLRVRSDLAHGALHGLVLE